MRKAAIVVALAFAAFSSSAQATPIGHAHRVIRAKYHPDGFLHYRIERCRRVTRTVTDCDLLLSGPVAGESICLPDSEGGITCDTSPADSQLPPDTMVEVTVRVHRDSVWENLA